MDTTPQASLRLITTADRLERGWPIGSSFIEEFWLPVLGPSCVAVLRWVDRRADRFPRATAVDLAELAQAIGLGASTSRHSPIGRTLDRLVRFNAARIDTIDDAPVLSVYTHLLPLPAPLVARLAYRLQIEHRRAVTALSGVA